MKFLLTLAAWALLSAGVSAATLDGTALDPCSNYSPDVTVAVNPSILCLVTDATENIDQSFTSAGGTEFLFIEKDDGAFGGGTELVIGGDSLLGTWSITNFLAGELYALVFKDGQNALPDAQVMYIVDQAAGTYTSPFFNDVDAQTQKDISHIALFGVTGGNDCCTRIDVPPVPLPASMLLLGTGLAGMAIWGKRKRKQAKSRGYSPDYDAQTPDILQKTCDQPGFY